MLLIFITSLTFLYLLVSSMFIILRDSHNRLNVSLSLATQMVGLWLVSVAGLYSPMGSLIMYGRGVFALGMLSVYGLLTFVTLYLTTLKKIEVSRTAFAIASVVTAIVLCMTMTPAILAGVEPVTKGLPTPISGKLFPVYMLWMFALAGLITKDLLRALRGSHGRQRAQVMTVMASIVLYVVLAFSTQLVLPRLFNNVQIANFAPLSAVALAAGLSYAVVKHRFLNIRLILARTVSYFLTWGFLAVMYFLFVGIVVRWVLGGKDITLARQGIYLTFVVLAAVSYGRIKRIFDRLSNRLFYRDAYDPQDFISDINSVLVSSVGLEELLRLTSKVIAKHLKSQFSVFFITSGEGVPRRIMGDKGIEFSETEQDLLARACGHYSRRVMVVDRLERVDTLKEALEASNVDLLIGLGTSGKHNKAALGCLLIGPRKSGQVYTEDDLRLLHIIAYELAIAIQNALRYEKIAGFNQTLQTEIAHATQRLRQANQRLKTLDELKDDFISMASHQFRTPAGSIRQALQMLNNNNTNMSAAERKEILRLAEADSEELVTLVGTMLNISRLQAGRFVIEKAATDLVELLGRVVDTTNVLAERKGNKLIVKTSEPHILAMVDAAKIKEAMTNYIENAIKYSPSKTTIRISLNTEGASVRFEVLDQGMGVPEDERRNLFGRFYRARNARKEHPDGNGIGLYVVKSIIEGHDGEVYHEPQEQGSIFGFVVPLANKK